MFLVPVEIDREVKWAEVFEVESLEAFAAERNRGIKATLGPDAPDCFTVADDGNVDETDLKGKHVRSYCLCTKDGKLLGAYPQSLRDL